MVPPPAQTEIQESDVVGLIDDLAVRPLMGPGFAPFRAAYISDTGTLEAVQGSLDDCVRVDGTAGPCGAGAGPGFVDAEIPAGLMDGSNTVFTLADVPSPPSSLALYRNGVLQKEGVDYILAGAEIDFAAGSVPQLDDILVCSYRTASPGGMDVHDLLGPLHGDTTPGAAVRGDVIVAAGAPQATWTRLPIGPANRCLMSNGSDAIWNTCLYTGFSLGSVPFVNLSGALAQNNGQLNWDNINRRLSVGNSLAQATLYLYDAQPSTGVTNLVVRGGQGQGANPLQTWLDPNGAQLGQVDAAGNVAAASFGAVTTASRAAWRDAGSSSDPSTRTDGDVWYNTAAQARRSVEGGQTHALPQVICSSTGSGSSSATLDPPGKLHDSRELLAGGRPGGCPLQLFARRHGASFTFEIHWGATTILSRSGGHLRHAGGWIRRSSASTRASAPVEHAELGIVTRFRRCRIGDAG